MIRLLCVLAVLAVPAWAQPPAERLARLRHGVNITGWFRYPGSRDPAYLARWMSDSAMEDLRRAGFGFVRLAIDPPVADAPGMRDIVVDAVCRLQRHGLAVLVDAHPTDWHLETSAADRVGLRRFWRAMASALRRCDPALTIPEVLNEPVFPGDPGGWAALQHAILGDIRSRLPDSTVVLTGNGWGSIDGLLTLQPEADPNTIYSFHFYDPTELISLASYRPGLDRQALARLPFPVGDRAACEATATGDPATAGLIRYYCATGWDRATIVHRIEIASSWAHTHRVVLMAGEFGATTALNPAARLAWLGAVRQSLDAAGIGWALWGYDDIMGFAVQRPPGGKPLLDGNVLRVLGLSRAQ